jgi:signal transduction histidine kinase
LLREEIRVRNAKIQIEAPMPTVQANATILQQIFGNLISNAIKFVPAGHTPALHIWCEEREKSYRIWFADNGIGVDPKHHERIFKVFERLHVGPAYPGTGIGLAIVRKGAERIGAQVGLESELGKGSRFWIEFARH